MQNRNPIRRSNRPAPPTETDKTEGTPVRKGHRSAVRVIVICICVTAVAIGALTATRSILREPNRDELPAYSYVSDTRDIYFYEPQPDIDIFTDEAWLDEDRYLYYYDGAEGMILTEERNEAGKAGALFLRYFSALMHGDAHTYASLFTAEYSEENALPEYFTMQRVYNIRVEKTLEAELTDGEYAGKTRALFTVSYCIMRNDGTFRRDISGNGTAPQVFELLADGDTVLINGIEPVRQVQ